jgi:hypothetical protein
LGCDEAGTFQSLTDAICTLSFVLALHARQADSSAKPGKPPGCGRFAVMRRLSVA